MPLELELALELELELELDDEDQVEGEDTGGAGRGPKWSSTQLATMSRTAITTSLCAPRLPPPVVDPVFGEAKRLEPQCGQLTAAASAAPPQWAQLFIRNAQEKVQRGFGPAPSGRK